LVLTVTDNTGVSSKTAKASYTVISDSSLQPTTTIAGDNSVIESREMTLTAKAIAKGGRTIPADGYHWIIPKNWIAQGAINKTTLIIKAPAYQTAGEQGEIKLTVKDSTGAQSNEISHIMTINREPSASLCKLNFL
jgi:hypothetical protein